MEAIPAGLKPLSALLPSIALIAATLILAACGDKPSPPQPPAPQTAPTQLFQQERAVLDKAKGVEQTESKSTDDLKREEEKQTK
jgi:hypothetical protein